MTPLFREQNSAGNPTLIASKVLHQYPFFDRTIQKTVYENVNGYLNLPVYGPNIFDSPLRRTYSCVGVKFTSESGTVMSVELNAENHTWDDGVVTTEPTASAEGVRTYTCTTCGETRAEAVAKLKPNTLALGVASMTYGYAELAEAKTFGIGASGAQGEVTYAPDAAATRAKIEVTPQGLVTVPAGCPVGTYEIKVTAAGGGGYAAGSKTVTVKVTKAANTLRLKVSSRTYNYAKLAKAKTFKIGASGAQGKVTYAPNAAAKKAKVKVTSKGKVTVPARCPAGTYKIVVTAAGGGGYAAGSKTVTVKVTKAANTLRLKVSSKAYRRSRLTKAQTFKIGATKAQGKVTYAPNAAAKKAKVKVTSKGKVTVPKNCKKGTYKITVKAAGNKNYKAGKKTVKIVVK